MDNAVAVLDRAGALGRMGGDERMYLTLCRIFLEDAPGQLYVLECALAQGSAGDARLEAHTLKTSARTVGAVRLGEMLADIESSLKQGDLGTAGAILSEVGPEFAEVLALIRAEEAGSRS